MLGGLSLSTLTGLRAPNSGDLGCRPRVIHGFIIHGSDLPHPPTLFLKVEDPGRVERDALMTSAHRIRIVAAMFRKLRPVYAQANPARPCARDPEYASRDRLGMVFPAIQLRDTALRDGMVPASCRRMSRCGGCGLWFCKTSLDGRDVVEALERL